MISSRLKGILFLFIILVSAACSSPKAVTQSEPEPEPKPEPIPVLEVDDPIDLDGWHLHEKTGSALDINLDKAYKELLADKEAKQEVIVAIIDSGIDRFHEDLADHIWVNEDEIPGNGLDDDENGYIDDIYGWNFIGGKDSTHVRNDSYELTRIYFDLADQFAGRDKESISEDEKSDYKRYKKLFDQFEQQKIDLNQELETINQIAFATNYAKQNLGISMIQDADTLDLELKDSDTEALKNSKQVMAFLLENNIDEELLLYELDRVEASIKSLDPANDTRYIVGDDYKDLEYRYYGNNDVYGPYAEHGTHVAGIVAAIRNNELGAMGVTDAVKIMILRTVPNGDERDKDVANAIRYAVENGAKVINMSFGKSFSPQKEYVDAAVKFADEKDVLMVHGAGNDAKDIDKKKYYPSKDYVDSSGVANNWLTVGASSWKETQFLPATFSNYGKENVDLFAPGVDIYSTTPEDNYKKLDGTSMASPVVAGVAALIMAYYPDLSASQVKEILLETVTPVEDKVYVPGKDELIPFSDLSKTGGVVNAYEALLKAAEISEN